MPTHARNTSKGDTMRPVSSHLRRGRWAGGVLAVAATASLLAVAGAAPASASRPAVAATTPACASSSLVVWLNTQGNGAAGSAYYNLEFTNLSHRACSLFGYPGVSGMDLMTHQVGRPASRDAVRTPRRVTLAAGASAHAVLRIVDADNFPRSACGQVTAAGLRVYPPGQTASKMVPYPFRACSYSGPAYLQVAAVQAGLGAVN